MEVPSVVADRGQPGLKTSDKEYSHLPPGDRRPDTYRRQSQWGGGVGGRNMKGGDRFCKTEI